MEDGSHYSPDVIFSYERPTGEASLFCLEIYNGNRTKYVVEQLKKLFWIIERTTKIGDKVQLQKSPRVLCVFDNQTLLENTIRRLQEDKYFSFQGIDRFLLFNVDHQVWKDFGSNWQTIEGEVISLEQLYLSSIH